MNRKRRRPKKCKPHKANGGDRRTRQELVSELAQHEQLEERSTEANARSYAVAQWYGPTVPNSAGSWFRHKRGGDVRDKAPRDLDDDWADDYHVYPDFPGERKHKMTVKCWCCPRRDEMDPNLVIHNRWATA